MCPCMIESGGGEEGSPGRRHPTPPRPRTSRRSRRRPPAGGAEGETRSEAPERGEGVRENPRLRTIGQPRANSSAALWSSGEPRDAAGVGKQAARPPCSPPGGRGRGLGMARQAWRGGGCWGEDGAQFSGEEERGATSWGGTSSSTRSAMLSRVIHSCGRSIVDCSLSSRGHLTR